MSDLLKEVYTRNYLEEVAREFKRNYKSFNSKLFISTVLSNDWKNLELKMRMKRITFSLNKVLPKEYDKSIVILTKSSTKFSGYQAMFFPDYVETYGRDSENITKSLDALEELTKYSSSEFAIRPFIIADKNKVMKKMLSWSRSKNYHVRRLSSEGCRSRLPWAMALKSFKEDPSLILPILENLKDDPELYVRKSVANNLNDISKDHPGLVLEIAKRWYGVNKNTDWIVKHGLRTLLKQGSPKALRIIGYSDSKNLAIRNIKVDGKVNIGLSLNFSFEFSVAKKSKVRLEYKIYYLKSNGNHNSKVFKISEGEYSKGSYEVLKKQSFKEMTTRKHYSGKHFLSIVVNGEESSKVEFRVL